MITILSLFTHHMWWESTKTSHSYIYFYFGYSWTVFKLWNSTKCRGFFFWQSQIYKCWQASVSIVVKIIRASPKLVSSSRARARVIRVKEGCVASRIHQKNNAINRYIIHAAWIYFLWEDFAIRWVLGRTTKIGLHL